MITPALYVIVFILHGVEQVASKPFNSLAECEEILNSPQLQELAAKGGGTVECRRVVK